MFTTHCASSRPLRRRPLLLGILVAIATPSFAQQPPAAVPQAAAQDSASSAPTDLDRMVVTGSRIRRAGLDTLEPATVVSKEFIAERGLSNVADAINEMPGFGVGVTPEGGQSTFGVGVNFVNRFGLGSNRTLTLVNGRRYVSSNGVTLFGPGAPGMQVDLNAIPTSMVERVENLAIGGAPTYGSDAIAGVVNVILRKDFEGVEAGASYGVTGEGDNQRFNVHSTIGASFGKEKRGNVTVSLSYDNVNGVLQRDRDFFAARYTNASNPNASVMNRFLPGRTPGNDGRVNPNVPFNTGNNDGIPNGVQIANTRFWEEPFGGYVYPVTGAAPPGLAVSGHTLVTPRDGTTANPLGPDGLPDSVFVRARGFGANADQYLGFAPNGNLVPYNPGIPYSLDTASGGDGMNLVDSGQITADVKRMTFMGNARYKVTDSIDAFVESTFYSAESFELADQWAYNAPSFGGLSGAIRFPADHPMLNAQARQTLAQYGASSFMLGRASRDLVENKASGTTELTRVVYGLEGNFELADRVFYWEVSGNYGRSDSRFYGTSLNQQNFINALNVEVVGGQVVCAGRPIAGLVIPGGNTPIADPNCVPLSLFGDGAPSDAAKRYVTQRTASQSLLEQEVYNANISSTAFDLWSGPVSYNVGFEHRKETGLFDPDTFLQKGLGRSVAITPLSGKYTTNEWFGEFVVPLINPERTFPGLRKLDVVGKFRQVDNSINGKFDTYTYGLQWKPFEDLEIRGNFTRSLRAPAITEAFLPQAESFQFVTGDPCDSRFINSGGARQAQRTTNCKAFLDYYGLSNFTSTAAGSSIRGVSGGNPDLENESADSYTYGFTWAPSFLEGFALTADYYNIKIEGVISSLTASQLALACFDSTDFNAADVPNANAFCSKIVRNPAGSGPTSAGQATTFTSGFVNGKYLNMEAYSAEARYGFDTGWGRFNIGLVGYFPRKLIQSNTGITEDESVGEIGTSERQYLLSGNWQGKNWSAGLSANYLSSAVFNVLDVAETRDILSVGSQTTFNANTSYRFADNRGVVRLAITNLTDKDPPFPTTGIGTYDLLGRRYNLSFEWKY
ncbi:TonB-dependent receptor domain-containing protein [Pseudomonas sp. CGJS7]|uniref:TonB-dependent receptor domain-containing protein n=1 Tax=Pseudomonas sp. CGJS7 TaxID=3109348 RepID=UPI00300B8E85